MSDNKGVGESRLATDKSKIRPSTRTFAVLTLTFSAILLLWTTAILLLEFGLHPLQHAILNGKIDAIQRAIAGGADVNALDSKSGDTMLTLVTEYGRHNKELIIEKPEMRHQKILEMLRLLIENGADVNARNRFGHTVLWLATSKPYYKYPVSQITVDEHRNVVALLIENNANLNAKCGAGSTALHRAVIASIENANLKVVQLLLEKGANVNMRNDDGKTPLQLAVRAKEDKIADLLKQYGAKE